MGKSKTLKISETDVKRIRLALALSIVFVFLNIHVSLGAFPISLSFIVVAVILSRIHPLSDEALLEDDADLDSNRDPVALFHQWLQADPARKYMSKKDQLTSFRNQVPRREPTDPAPPAAPPAR